MTHGRGERGVEPISILGNDTERGGGTDEDMHEGGECDQEAVGSGGVGLDRSYSLRFLLLHDEFISEAVMSLLGDGVRRQSRACSRLAVRKGSTNSARRLCALGR